MNKNYSIKSTVENIQREIDQLPIDDISSLRDNNLSGDSKINIIIQKFIHKLDPEIKSKIESEFFGYGPIEYLLNDNEITEIIINGKDQIYFEKKGTLHRHPESFYSSINFANFIQRICSEAGIYTTLNHPFADGRWKKFRLHIASPPISGNEPCICLRQHPSIPWTLESFKNLNWCDNNQSEILKCLICEKKNLLIIGPTGSGKTSVLNACLQELKSDCRTVILEDSEELCLPNHISTKLLTREDPSLQLSNIDLALLVKQALRMRPDRIIVGEIRGPEAKDLLLALSTGHTGSWGTLHAHDPHQAITRLEMLIQLGAPNWSQQAIRSLIFSSLNAIIVVGKNPESQRILKGIYAITSLEETGFLLEKIC